MSRAPSHVAPRVTARAWWVTDALLLVLAVALLVALLLTWRSGLGEAAAPDPSAQRASALQRDASAAAGAETVAFLEVDHDDMPAVVDRVLDGATGRLREEYAAGADRLTASVERRRATVDASLRAVGLTEVEDTRAVALVAADSLLVDRSTGEDGVLRKHRLRLVLEQVDGRWLVSELEFVR